MNSPPAARGPGLPATALVCGETGVLILGPAGSGKSALALALMARARDAGTFAALVGDDRVYVRRTKGRLVAYGAPHLAGVIERRMVGLVSVDHEPAAVIRLAIELSERGKTWPRMPDDQDVLTLGDVRLPRLALDSARAAADQALAVEERLRILTADKWRKTRFSLEHRAAVHKNRRSELSPPA